MSKNGRILYVDDEEINLSNFRETLSDKFEIFTACSGKEGLAILAREGEMALVISDQRMPEMSGIELLIQVKEAYPDTIRMIISAYTDILDLLEAINKAEIYRYFVKPWQENSLRLTISNAVDTYNLGREIKGYIAEGRKQMAKRNQSFGRDRG